MPSVLFAEETVVSFPIIDDKVPCPQFLYCAYHIEITRLSLNIKSEPSRQINTVDLCEYQRHQLQKIYALPFKEIGSFDVPFFLRLIIKTIPSVSKIASEIHWEVDSMKTPRLTSPRINSIRKRPIA